LELFSPKRGECNLKKSDVSFLKRKKVAMENKITLTAAKIEKLIIPKL
jgi:hypothetical protein